MTLAVAIPNNETKSQNHDNDSSFSVTHVSIPPAYSDDEVFFSESAVLNGFLKKKSDVTANGHSNQSKFLTQIKNSKNIPLKIQ